MEQSDNQTEQSGDQKRTFRRRFKDLLFGHRSKQFFTDPRTWFEVAALAVLCVYTVFTGQTLSEIKNANKIDQRAWVSITKFVLKKKPSATDTDIEVGFSLINTGKTPAINCTFQRQPGFVLDPPNKFPCSWNVRATEQPVFVLMPGTEQEKTPPWSSDAPNVLLYYHGAKDLYIQVKVWYDDVFGEHHWATTCRWHKQWQADDDFSFCPSGTEIDNAEQQGDASGAPRPCDASRPPSGALGPSAPLGK
jgi:hypothetical protein